MFDQLLEPLRTAPLEDLRDEKRLADIICRCGLAGIWLEEAHWVPEELYPHTGKGLHLFQSPNQFAPYLIALSKLDIESYIEIGCYKGGTFIFTVEYLNRFRPLRRAVAVDSDDHEQMAAYAAQSDFAEHWVMSCYHIPFQERVKDVHFDFGLVDADHSFLKARHDFFTLHLKKTPHIALHDISNDVCPDVRFLWAQLKETLPEYRFEEFVEQYPHHREAGTETMGMGIMTRVD